jgi:lysophospholipase L1-like esterase
MLLLRKFLPALPDYLKENPVWNISLNAHGFREKEFHKKSPLTFRIICLGDSWTFGANVGQEETYPRQLEQLLEQEFHGSDFEVLNLGVLGYSSYQGLELLKKEALKLKADLIVIAFAMNDSSTAGYRDKDIPGSREEVTLVKRIGNVLDKLETYKLLKYTALKLKYRPQSISRQLKTIAESADKPDEAIDYNNLEPWIRVSPGDYKKNIIHIIDLAKKNNISPILLYNQLSHDAGEVAGIGYLGTMSPYYKVLEDISRATEVPLVDSSALISEASINIEEELEKKRGLRPVMESPNNPHEEAEVIFRVDQGSHLVSKSIYISGTHSALGNTEPNTIRMYDDGTHGDQTAGDKIWSYTATFSPGTKIFYVYTNSGEEGKWEGLDVPYIRTFSMDSRRDKNKIYLPIETFGKVYMQADSWHTDVSGYELIAKALSEVIKQDEKVKRYLDSFAVE